MTRHEDNASASVMAATPIPPSSAGQSRVVSPGRDFPSWLLPMAGLGLALVTGVIWAFVL